MVTIENRRRQQKKKPKPIVQFNAYMKGTDRLDQMMSYYPCERKTIRCIRKCLSPPYKWWCALHTTWKMHKREEKLVFMTSGWKSLKYCCLQLLRQEPLHQGEIVSMSRPKMKILTAKGSGKEKCVVSATGKERGNKQLTCAECVQTNLDFAQWIVLKPFTEEESKLKRVSLMVGELYNVV